MRTRRSFLAPLLGMTLGLACLATPTEARAESAQKLFDGGLKAMLDGNFAEGCPALEKSYELDPLPGVLFTTAACFERWGKVHTAVKKYERFVELHEQRDLESMPEEKRERAEERGAEAKKKLEELRPKVPTITVSIPSAPDSEVQIDGVYAKGTSSMDPGEHQIIAVAPDGRRKDKTVTLAVGEQKTVSFEFGVITAPEPEPEVDDGSTRDNMIIGAVVTGSLGIVGLAVGGVTGGLVLAKKGDVDDQCVELVCTPEGKEAADEAQTLGLVSTVTFIVGGAGVATAALLFLLAPSEQAEDAVAGLDVRVGEDGAFVGWRAQF